MNASYIPRVYRIAELSHDIVTIQIDSSTITPLWIAFFDHNPRGCTTGKDEANAVFTLLKTLVLINAQEEPEQGVSEKTEPPVEQTRNGEFWWKPELVDVLKSDFREMRLADTKKSIEAIARDIATKHAWPVNAVKYKIYQLKLPQQPMEETRTEPAPPQHKPGTKERSLPAITLQVDTSIPILAQGNVAWQVRVDGMPLTWKIDYPHGSFPHPQNSCVKYRETVYRIRRAGEMTLDVSSEEADVYAAQSV